jgi:hypothetical protein
MTFGTWKEVTKSRGLLYQFTLLIRLNRKQ